MAVETKKMANSIAAARWQLRRADEVLAGADQDFLQRRAHARCARSPRLRSKKCGPRRRVVIITVFIFALYFWVIDFVIQQRRDALFKLFQGALTKSGARRAEKKH